MTRKRNLVQAVGYVRTSSAANIGRDKDSERRQRLAIERFAKAAGYAVVDWFNDPAVSGADPIESRPGFAALLNHVLGLPIVEVTIADGGSYLQRGSYTPGHDRGVECLGILCLAGSEGERLFFSGDDGDDYFGDNLDRIAVRDYLLPRSELEFIAEVARLRAAARRPGSSSK